MEPACRGADKTLEKSMTCLLCLLRYSKVELLPTDLKTAPSLSSFKKRLDAKIMRRDRLFPQICPPSLIVPTTV